MRTFTLAFGLFLSVATTARADDLTLSTSADPVEDSPITVTASGSAATSGQLLVGWSSDGACDGTYSHEDVVNEDLPSGSFSVAEPTGQDDPGDYVLCGVLSPDDDTSVTRSQLAVHVRSNQASVHIVAPPVMAIDRDARVLVTGTTELGRNLQLEVHPGSTCGDHSWGWLNGAVFEDPVDVAPGSFSVSVPFRVGDYGRYSLCAWVNEDWMDQPEAQSGQLLYVTPPCTMAWHRFDALKAALRRALRAADASWHVTRGLRRWIRNARRDFANVKRFRARACPAAVTPARR